MTAKEKFLEWFIAHPRCAVVCRAVLWTGIAVIIWIFSSKAIQDILVYGAFIFALSKASRSLSVWKQPAGVLFVIVLLYTICSLPFSNSPYLSAREFTKFLQIVAGAFAIPVIFDNHNKIRHALLYSAIAISLTLCYDLARLYYRLGPDILEQAHGFEPFILNHSNVASMMAGACCFVFFYFLWRSRRHYLAMAAYAIGIVVCLGYILVLASRGPQLAFAVTCSCAGILIPRRRGKLIWAVCIIACWSMLIANIQQVNPRFLEESTMENFSDRDKVWRHTWELARSRPWFGHGYGKRNFVDIYYSSDPPAARFTFPHTHQFWLKILFEFGWIGLALHFAAWSLLAWQIARRIFSTSTFEERLLPGTAGLILLFIHLYGFGDYPDNVLRMAQFWLIPVALVLISTNSGGSEAEQPSSADRCG